MANWFKEFESRPIRGKTEIPWVLTTEYAIQGKYLVTNLKSLPSLETASDLELLATAQHCNNLISYIEQMRIMGFAGFPGVIEDLLEVEFGNRHLLVDLQRAYTEKWVSNKSGQHKIGENYFSIYQDKFYYSTIRREWYEVASNSVFDIMPTLHDRADSKTCEVLNHDYRPTKYQQIYSKWRDAGYTGKLSQAPSKTGQTTPEDVLKNTITIIRAISAHPPSLEEIERSIVDRPDYLEYLIKISCIVIDFAQWRRASNEHTLYLLRDCAMFHEAQIILDLLEDQPTSHDQIYLGRQSLSSQRRDSGHWYACQELLLLSLQKHPGNFTDFYADFTKRLKDYEKYSPEFASLVQELAKYLDNHIEEAVQNKLTINVIDLGFQGSINMIVKYVLDQYCLQKDKLPSKIHVYVVAEWFKDAYENMYTSNTFSLLTHIEVMARNNAIYEYVPWSLRDGKLLVAYGSKNDQAQANIELTVMTVTALLGKQLDILVA